MSFEEINTDLSSISSDDVEEFSEFPETKTDLESVESKKSYVWKYFIQLDSAYCKCQICDAICVGMQIQNLSKHLSVAHNIRRNLEYTYDIVPKGRPPRSFIWKYCSRENPKRALCHLCDKLLFFGGGNTSNIAKHLRRKHKDVLEPKELRPGDDILLEEEETDRKCSSYVWNYCKKISNNSVFCNLCRKIMSFHGTANIIMHLARRHRVTGKSENESENMNIAGISSINIETLDMPDILETSSEQKSHNRPAACHVWKYCKLLNMDLVRCLICCKHLSYQGTGNLQRHLHRIHDIMPESTRKSAYKEEFVATHIENSVIWDYCRILENNKAKCNICDYESDKSEIPKHMFEVHAIEKNELITTTRLTKNPDNEKSSTEDSEEKYMKDWSKNSNGNIEILTEDLDDSLEKDFIDIVEIEEVYLRSEGLPTDKYILEDNNDIDTSQSSPTSSLSSEPQAISEFHDYANLKHLREELIRARTECFKEKAAYYKMKKHLSTLQALKLRLEMNQNSQSDSNLNLFTIDSALTDTVETF